MKSVLVVGLGRFGRHLCRCLTEKNNQVLAIDHDEVRCNQAVAYASEVQIADGTDPAVIERLGVRNFDFCVVAIADDFQSSLETAALLADNGARYVLARANSDVHEKFLLRNGADEVVYAERDMAERIAMRFGTERIKDYIKLGDGYAIFEIKTPVKWIGKTISGVGVRQNYNVNIISIKDSHGTDPMPDADRVFREDDFIMVMGHNDDIAPLLK